MLQKTALICTIMLLLIAALAVSAGMVSVPSQQQPLPSITPLFSSGQPQNMAPFGSSGSSGFSAQAQPAATLPPGQVTVGPVVVQQVVVTSPPGTIPTIAPAIVITDNTVQQSDTFLTNLFNNVIVPVINFLLTIINGTIVTIWNFAGAQGGFLGQALCCIAPALAGGYWFIFRRLRRR